MKIDLSVEELYALVTNIDELTIGNKECKRCRAVQGLIEELFDKKQIIIDAGKMQIEDEEDLEDW